MSQGKARVYCFMPYTASAYNRVQKQVVIVKKNNAFIESLSFCPQVCMYDRIYLHTWNLKN